MFFQHLQLWHIFEHGKSCHGKFVVFLNILSCHVFGISINLRCFWTWQSCHGKFAMFLYKECAMANHMKKSYVAKCHCLRTRTEMKLAMANANTTLPLVFFYQICHDNVIKICYECEIIQNVQYLKWQKHLPWYFTNACHILCG